MAADNAASDEPTLFSAVLTPHRSLGRTGFVVLMCLIGGISFVAGLVFFIAGAWPVMGFFGLDVLLIYIAFKVSYRSAAAYEQVTMTASTLTVRKVSHRGRVAEWTLNPVWVRLQREETKNSGSSGCSWCRAGDGCRSRPSSGRPRRRASPMRSRRRSGKRGAGRRGRCLIRIF